MGSYGFLKGILGFFQECLEKQIAVRSVPCKVSIKSTVSIQTYFPDGVNGQWLTPLFPFLLDLSLTRLQHTSSARDSAPN